MAQAITDSARFALQQRAREVLGEQEGDTLMAHLPPVGWADVATKQDLQVLSGDIDALRVATKHDIDSVRAEVEGLRTEMKQEFVLVRAEAEGLRTEMKQEFVLVRAEVEGLFALVRGELNGLDERTKAHVAESVRRQTVWMASLILGQATLFFGGLMWILDRLGK